MFKFLLNSGQKLSPEKMLFRYRNRNSGRSMGRIILIIIIFSTPLNIKYIYSLLEYTNLVVSVCMLNVSVSECTVNCLSRFRETKNIEESNIVISFQHRKHHCINNICNVTAPFRPNSNVLAHAVVGDTPRKEGEREKERESEKEKVR